MTGISDGMEAKNPQGFKQSQIIFAYPSPPPLHTPTPTKRETNKQTDKNTKRKNLFFNETTLTQKILG